MEGGGRGKGARTAIVILLTGMAAAPLLLPEPVDVAAETLWAADYAGVSFKTAWRKAAQGDASAIRTLLLLRADAAASLGHGTAIIRLLDRAGEAAVAAEIGRLVPEQRFEVRGLLEAGVAYKTPGGDPADAPRLYPKCWAAASP